MNEVNTKQCPICARSASLKYSRFTGYVESQSYDIYECSFCQTSFADPLKSEDWVYDSIYKQSTEMPGYERYYRYSNLVKRFRKPLKFLSSTEPSYWSVVSEIEKNKAETSILEIGSGLGYLTYAFNSEGFNSLGIDLSEEAVNKSINNFGPYFKTADLFILAKENLKFDYVIMMDVIEHVEDPVSFVKAASCLLKEQGKLLVTTPNKTAAPDENSVWQSDSPPVHLWFLSEKSISTIAEIVGLEVSFKDFTIFNRKFHNPLYTSTLKDMQKNLPVLDRKGNLKGGKVQKKIKDLYFDPKIRYYLSYLRRRFLVKNKTTKSTTLCAILTKS